MKTIKILFSVLLLVSGSVLFAQNGYYNNSNSITRYGGVDRNIGRSYSKPKPETPEEIEADRNERVDKFVSKLKTELTLDELQVIAIKNELISNSKNIEIILKKEDSQEEKTEQVKASMDKAQIVIKSYLNKAQKEKYDVYMEQMKNNVKDKKDKKKDKEKEKPTEE